MTDTISLELDFAYDEDSLLDALTRTTKDYPTITYRVVNESGPGGGWPIVRFVGSMFDMHAFLIDAYSIEDARVLLEVG